LRAAAGGVAAAIFSRKVLTLIKVFLIDVLFQDKIRRNSFSAWLMHLLVFYGFLLLLLMHALGGTITVRLFPEYNPTLNPFLFLRNFFGLLVLAGLGIGVYRRLTLKRPRFRSRGMDYYAVIILAVIILSGILLEGAKISSYSAFRSMEEDYAGLDQDELAALESYWVEHYGLVSPGLKGPFDREVLAKGAELNENYCAGCHSSPKSAFLGFATAKAISPWGGMAEKADLPSVLYYLHVLACFFGLAYLPFSKMFHVFASPVSLLVNSVSDGNGHPANAATRQVMELDACTHCGACTERCAVGVVLEEIPNPNILPSEKIASLRDLARGNGMPDREVQAIQEGLYLCTNCYRCTGVCPVGINLQQLWSDVREDLLARGFPEILALSLLSFYRARLRDELGTERFEKSVDMAKKALADCFRLGAEAEYLTEDLRDAALVTLLRNSVQSRDYSQCFTCTTCTSACPLPKQFDQPHRELDLVPHQIIHAAILGLKDVVLNSRMLWACLGCYQCQEHCPQNVPVTDVFYQLKNLANDLVKKNTC
ncbi:MAG: 4Fe-4S dicluster domain-containing protein, partial [Thermodesulfobacteriota bacterium]